MGRHTLFCLVLSFSALQLSAQSGQFNLEFVENKGQWDAQVKFKAEMTAGAFFLQQKGFSVLLNDTTDLRRISSILHGNPGTGPVAGSGRKVASTAATPPRSPVQGPGSDPVGVSDNMTLHSHIYSVSFEGANDNAGVVPEKPMTMYNNYFIGDRSHWVTKAKIYQGITYQNIYNGIDIHYYSDGSFLKYDLIVHPGADPSQIALKYQGQDKLTVRRGRLEVKTSVTTVKELEPRTYQVDGKGRTEIACAYAITGGNIVRFKLGNYDPTATLVIDPTEVFCSFTGSRSDNWGYTSTYDPAGNFYAGGIAIGYSRVSGNNFGATAGAFQRSFQGGDGSEGTTGGQNAEPYNFDVAIMKFSSNGKTALYATYLGGAGNEQPHSMICDPQGNLIVTGRSSSANFPPTVFSSPAFAGTGLDIFIAKLSADGSNLIGSVKIGGGGDDGVNNSPKYRNTNGVGTKELRLNYGDDGRGEVILDAANNIYVVSCTQSTNFPCTANAFQSTGGGGQDGVVLKVSPDANSVIASSYLGGNAADAAFSLALNPIDNNIYVSGGTMSTDLKGTGNGPVYQSTNRGGVDGFVTILSNNGANLGLIKTTYFGTAGTDMIYGIQFDKEGNPYIMGTTTSPIPIVNSPFNQNNNQATGNQFITKLKPDLSAIIYSANFGPGGGTPNISPTAFLVDRCENVYVSGWGGGIDIDDHYLNAGTNGLKTTPNAIKLNTDGADFYFFVLQKNAASQLYGSFFGQPGGQLGDHVDGGTSRFDKQGIIYQSVCANCDGPDNIFPVTPNVWAQHNGALSFGGCNEAAVKISFNFAGVAAGLKTSLAGRGDTLGCVPLDVVFQDTIRLAKLYFWDFGDGTYDTTTSNQHTHTYNAVGTYKVMLIGVDSSTCNVADTVYRTVTAKDNRANLDFTITKNAPCTANSYTFSNISTYSGTAPNFTPGSFSWDFGDGNGIPQAGLGDVIHTYAAPGPYTVVLALTDTSYCNYPETKSVAFYVAQNVKAQFETPAIGCAPYNAVFNNTSIAGSRYLWDFGDNTTSTDMNPAPHPYNTPGTYIIKLTVEDDNTCNKIDSYSMTITIYDKPSGDFNFVPSPPVPNTPTVFSAAVSPDVVKWQWFFGDGESTVKANGDTVSHQYNETDTFNACLVITNPTGCTDTICHPVPVLIDPLLDVPNAFTPGRFGQNGVVKVAGFGITHMIFRIYNRWGKLVFQSNDRNTGWDGMYKGELQPMDVYAYTLEADFFDGKHVTKKGDITLIR